MDLSVSPKKLKLNKIPTKLDIVRAVVFEKKNWMNRSLQKKEPKISNIADKITQQIQKMHTKAGIRVIRKDKIKEKVIQIYNYQKKFMKFPKSKRNSKNFTQKKKAYDTFMSEFLNVQCRSDANKKNIKPKNKNMKYNDQAEVYLSDEFDDEASTRDCDDPDFVPHQETTPLYNERYDLSEIAEAQSRFSSSDRSTIAIVNATLRTFSIPVVIDKSILRRANKRKHLETEIWKNCFGGGLYYDSRKDKSLFHTTKVDEHGKLRFYRNIKKETHYSLVSQPEGMFLGYVVPKGGTADKISSTILSFLKNENMIDDLLALGSDGENLNVGGDRGINSYIEVELGRPLHWFVCLLHTNELPLKNLMCKLDGKTTSSGTFSGPVGKLLEDVSSPVVKFKRFTFSKELPNMPEVVFRKLSNDQKYLYRIVNALVTGNFPDSLANLKIGKLNHSRWITTASRICRVFVTILEPQKLLKDLAAYVVDVYAPTWFQIKKNELAVDGPKNLFSLIERSNRMKNTKMKSIVQKCIRRNAFFAHSENLLLAQLSSKILSERLSGVTKILEIREAALNRDKIRRFTVPTINFEAKTWTNMIEWDEQVTEPPFTTSMNDDELMDLIENALDVPKFKCHTQMVERAVKEVSRVSSKLISHEKRISTVSATLISRAKYPKMESKKDFYIEQKDPTKFLPII